MARSITINSVNNDTGFVEVTFIDTDGTRIETSVTVPLVDGEPPTTIQVLDFLADQWPTEEFVRLKTPSFLLSSLLGESIDMEARLLALEAQGLVHDEIDDG